MKRRNDSDGVIGRQTIMRAEGVRAKKEGDTDRLSKPYWPDVGLEDSKPLLWPTSTLITQGRQRRFSRSPSENCFLKAASAAREPNWKRSRQNSSHEARRNAWRRVPEHSHL